MAWLLTNMAADMDCRLVHCRLEPAKSKRKNIFFQKRKNGSEKLPMKKTTNNKVDLNY